jgi:hypothetical protein
MEEREAHFASVRQLLQAERDSCAQLQANLAGDAPLVQTSLLQVYRQKMIFFPANCALGLPASWL